MNPYAFINWGRQIAQYAKNPRYLLPAVPFIAVGVARVLQYLRERNAADAPTWAGLAGASITLGERVPLSASNPAAGSADRNG